MNLTTHPPLPERCRVTVIMPILDEAEHIARSLGSVLQQTYPSENLEVLIADGMSSDDTRAIIARTIEEHPQVSVTMLDNHARIVSASLNLGLRHARGDVIIRVDGHCEIAPDYVARCVDHLRAGEADGVGGPIETVPAPGVVSEAIAAAMSARFGVGGAAFRTVKDRTMLADTVAFPAYTRAAVDLAGDFDEELVRNQDDEYNYRLRKLGAKVLLAQDVKSRYFSRQTLRDVWRQYFEYGFWKVRVMQKHPRQMRLRQFAPPVFVLGVLGGGLLSLLVPPLLWAWLGGLGLYALLNLTASVANARRAGWRTLPALPLVFAALHVSYGLGFLVGLVRFAHRWADR